MKTEYRSAPLTEANFKATRITVSPFLEDLPADAIGGSNKAAIAARPIRLCWRSREIKTDLPTDRQSGRPRGFLRDRGAFTKDFFAKSGAEVGDTVIFQRLGSHDFRLHLEKVGGGHISGNGTGGVFETRRIKRWAEIDTRLDQQKFRRLIAERDGLTCAITGSQTASVLDAAHLDKRASGGSDDPANGIILRADIHRLFDNDLLAIDPVTRRVLVSGQVDDTEYRLLDGKAVNTGADLNLLKPAMSVGKIT